ncbi:NUDIX domain-containing protein [Psychromicrobium sp. YIM B11713]|uniref:NUDIX hydrolase n=1 Tax=Psychromicrobium sp. YIM B11713 TaxID=3145233 RepID=UPI00374F0F6C
MHTTVHVSAVAIFNEHGELLTVRKRGTAKFQLPGGKPEGTESFEQAALREVLEEVGVQLDAADLRHLGHWEGPAANSDASSVSAQVYLAARHHEAVAQAEIAELRWISVHAEPSEDLAPLTSLFLLPLLRKLDPPRYPGSVH